MASATLTLIGMYNWDDTLFNSLVLPDGIDKDLFIDTLLLKAGEFEVLYPDPDFMKQAIAVWGSKWYRTFSRWLEGTQATWNPIHNYDRFETIKDEKRKTFDHSDEVDYTESRTANLQDKTTHNTTTTTEQTVSGTTEHDISAYDQTGYTPSSKDTVNNGTNKNSVTGDETLNTTGTDKHNTKGKVADLSGHENNSDRHDAHIYGNIGVTQAGDMLRNWYDISQWNLFDHMSDCFTNELLIPVY